MCLWDQPPTSDSPLFRSTPRRGVCHEFFYILLLKCVTKMGGLFCSEGYSKVRLSECVRGPGRGLYM